MRSALTTPPYFTPILYTIYVLWMGSSSFPKSLPYCFISVLYKNHALFKEELLISFFNNPDPARTPVTGGYSTQGAHPASTQNIGILS